MAIKQPTPRPRKPLVIEDETPTDIAPGWVVTFGDMMSLLLTFFIMLVAMSDIKEERAYQEITEALRRKFGAELATNAHFPGRMAPRLSPFKSNPTAGRPGDESPQQGGGEVRAPQGDHSRVESPRRDEYAVAAAAVFFTPGTKAMRDTDAKRLREFAALAMGKPQKIEVRGHASRLPLPAEAPFTDSWDLSFERSREVMRILTEAGIEANRLRLSTAAENEPLYAGDSSDDVARNDRVEVYLLSETIRRTDEHALLPQSGALKR